MQTKEKIVQFQAYVPLLAAICNPGLRDRHWELLSDTIGFEVRLDEVTPLKRLLQNDIMDFLPKVTEISDTASREWSIEKALTKMLGDWVDLSFELAPWKETGTFILKGGPVDEAQMLLDDHLVKSQAMMASPFAKQFQEHLVPWEAKLSRLQNILDNWLKCQGKWIYLEPIFGSEEIMKQIPREGNAFRQTDCIWRATMENVKHDPRIVAVAICQICLKI